MRIVNKYMGVQFKHNNDDKSGKRSGGGEEV